MKRQHMETSQRDGVDAEEVGRHQGMGLAGDELAPRGPGPVRCGLTSGVSQDLPHRGRGDAVPETAHLAMDASVAPCRVLSVEAQHEPTELRWGWRAPGSWLWRLGPVPGDEASVPADHRGGFHDQHDLTQSSAIERQREHRKHCPVGRCELRAVDLSLQDQDLMAKSQDLSVALVASHQQQPETIDEKAEQGCK